MALCTYLSESEPIAWLDQIEDVDLKALLSEVNALPDQRWAIQPKLTVIGRGWLRKPKPITLYALYSHLHANEWQVINFPPVPQGEMSLNLMVESRLIQTYLLGYLGGAGKRVAA